MDRLKKLGVPQDILALLARPPLLKGESKDDYYELLAGFIVDQGVRDRAEYLWAIHYSDCNWEIIRLRRMRALLIDSWRDQGRAALVQDRSPGIISNVEARLPQIYPEGVEPELVSARGLLMADAHAQLAYFDKTIDRLQNRCNSILQLFESRRAMVTYREREGLLRAREQQPLRIGNERQNAHLDESSAMEAAEHLEEKV